MARACGESRNKSLRMQRPNTKIASVPASGTDVTAEGVAVGKGTTGAGNKEALPTFKLDPSASAALLATIKVPPFTVVPPRYVFGPVRVNWPGPSFTRLPFPTMG